MDYGIVEGIPFHPNTVPAVRKILSSLIQNREPIVRVWYGSDGKMWLDEYNVLGRIGISTGPLRKIPLMVAPEAYYGNVILDQCIVRIQEAKSKRILYHNPAYSLPEFDIFRGTDGDYAWNVVMKGQKEVCASFKTEQGAINYTLFMQGQRMVKKHE